MMKIISSRFTFFREVSLFKVISISGIDLIKKYLILSDPLLKESILSFNSIKQT